MQGKQAQSTGTGEFGNVPGALADATGAAKIGRVSKSKLYLLMKDPAFPPKRILGPRTIRYRIDEVVAYFEHVAAANAVRAAMPPVEPAQCATPEARAKRVAKLAEVRAAKKAIRDAASGKRKPRVIRVRPPASHPIAPTGAVAEAMDRVSRNPSLNEAGQ